MRISIQTMNFDPLTLIKQRKKINTEQSYKYQNFFQRFVSNATS